MLTNGACYCAGKCNKEASVAPSVSGVGRPPTVPEARGLIKLSGDVEFLVRLVRPETETFV